ncbi:serine/threonine protein kinase [Streptomyces phaeochromogenes]|uniref:protein kinase domain-containing protein n=1 Tax=Streptomyces phaeochromogenes TaxID=1923 RepID=UPI002794F75A|nr:protein kinase [Streptomyces phaeochromogenes]MDQ0950019.1 serine/threonine protein kinase [Streptomyces phaeochromogenes]
MKNLQPSDPSSIGGYPLLSRLGAGGMGQVFLSRTPSGRLLALKTIREDLSSDPGFEERFAREIRNSDRVRSPWTVTVVDYSPAGQRPQWLATEYVPAPSLDEWVARHGPLPEAAVLSLAAELCGALQSVHQADLTHRDVKPGNVLLARDRPRLIDFGIARAADDPRHTQVGGVLGSPGFLAPDQAVGGVPAEPADVFSLAAVLVYAATGHGPFARPQENVAMAALVYRAVHEAPDLQGVPPTLVPVLASCLAKAPADRPTAAELGKRLEQIGARTGHWPDVRPPALATELAAHEQPTHTLVDPRPDLPPDLRPDLRPGSQPDPRHQQRTRPFMAPGPEHPAAGQTQDSTVLAVPGTPEGRRRPLWLVVAVTAAAAVAVTAVSVAAYAGMRGSGSDASDGSSGGTKTRPSASASASASATKPANPVRRILQAVYDLGVGESVQTNKTKLVMQRDGNLVITDKKDRPLWAAMTSGTGNTARFQDDGNLVVHNSAGKPVWASQTFGHPGAVLVLQADGNVVIKSGDAVLWAARTVR